MPSHVYLLRGGFMRMVGAGIYELLPLGMRVLHKTASIVREEMNRAGAHEILMPALLPADYFRESGRWETFGDTLLRLRDRREGDYHLGPTHEEIVTDLVRREVRSYRQLPLILYQVQSKFRDEPRPRAGLMRGREFIMKDAYSFDASEEAAYESYGIMRGAYHAIFKRIGFDYRLVEAHSGAMGGSTSAEFQILATTGEDAIVACAKCDYAANIEVAESDEHESNERGEAPEAADSTAERLEVHTPGVGSIDDVVAYLNHHGYAEVAARTMLKSLVYRVGDETVLAVVRGDHEVNEQKLAAQLGAEDVQLASDAEVERVTGAAVGFAGPVGFKGTVVVDPLAANVPDAFCGANRTDHHLAHVAYGRDYEGRIASLRNVTEGDPCPRCKAPLGAYRGIEGGHIFVLGTHYSSKMGASFLDPNGDEKPVVMGCYGIGVSRLMAAAIEQHHDANGIRWPMAIAPYQVIVTPIGKGEAVNDAALRLYEELHAAGVEVLLDDRDDRPGVKFKDADLLGIPLRVTIGQRGLDKGSIEIKRRTDEAAEEVELSAAADYVRSEVVRLGGRLASST